MTIASHRSQNPQTIAQAYLTESDEELEQPQLTNQPTNLNLQLEAKPEVQTKVVQREEETNEPAVCRICLTEEESSTDPLLTPCKCAGSMSYIHH